VPSFSYYYLTNEWLQQVQQSSEEPGQLGMLALSNVHSHVSASESACSGNGDHHWQIARLHCKEYQCCASSYAAPASAPCCSWLSNNGLRKLPEELGELTGLHSL
jgi:hypothetical protein